MRIAVPNKGSLSEPAVAMLREAGYRVRRDSKELVVGDPDNDAEFFYLRPRDIAVYVGMGRVDAGITGRDLLLDSGSTAEELMPLGFARSTFRFAAVPGAVADAEGLEGKRVATSYPGLVRAHLAERGVTADVVRLDGAVETAITLGVADAIADVVSTGRTLRKQGLAVFGDSLCDSEAVVVGRRGTGVTEAQRVFLRRLTGILHAKNYMMLDYNINAAKVDEASRITPGLSGPTVSPLANEDWVAVRAMVPRDRANPIMDELAGLGAEAILASDIRIARI